MYTSVKRRVISFIFVSMLSGLACLPAGAQGAAPLEFKFGYGLKEDSNQGRAAHFFAEQVTQLSKGRLAMKTVAAAALGNDNQMQDALVAGKQEMMVGSTATLVSLVKEMALWDAPFLFNSTAEADHILDGPVGQKVLDRLKAKGLVGLVYWENGFRNLTNNKRPIVRLEDLQGLKVRVMPNEIFIQAFKALGAVPEPLPFTELAAALRSGNIDGQENPYNTILSSKFYESQKYLSITNHMYSPWIVLASKAWWDKLSEADRATLMQAAKAARDFERQDTRAETSRALSQLKEKGMQINQLGFTEISRLRNRINPIYNKIGANVGLSLMMESQIAMTNFRYPNKK